MAHSRYCLHRDAILVRGRNGVRFTTAILNLLKSATTPSWCLSRKFIGEGEVAHSVYSRNEKQLPELWVIYKTMIAPTATLIPSSLMAAHVSVFTTFMLMFSWRFVLDLLISIAKAAQYAADAVRARNRPVFECASRPSIPSFALNLSCDAYREGGGGTVPSSSFNYSPLDVQHAPKRSLSILLPLVSDLHKNLLWIISKLERYC